MLLPNMNERDRGYKHNAIHSYTTPWTRYKNLSTQKSTAYVPTHHAVILFWSMPKMQTWPLVWQHQALRRNPSLKVKHSEQ